MYAWLRIAGIAGLLALCGCISSSGTAAPPLPSAATHFDDRDERELDQLARRTWAYLSSDWATIHHLPCSWRSHECPGGDYDNPAEIGFYALSWIGAYEMHREWSPSWPQVETEVTAVLVQLRAWQTGSQTSQPHGPNAYASSVFYQWYSIACNPPVVGTSEGTNQVVPSIDNAWLAACLITIREYGEANAHEELGCRARDILGDMNFRFWYDTSTHRFSWGGVQDPRGGNQADYYSNENRLINFVARAMGALTAEEFQSSLKVLHVPAGTYDGLTVDKTAWDGSIFTYLAPALFIREVQEDYGAKTIIPAIRAQIAYAKNRAYPAWGLSDCFSVRCDNYVQQGAPPSGLQGALESRPGLVAPYASALALGTPFSAEVVSNLSTLRALFPAAYDPDYGFHDSVMASPLDPDYGISSYRFSALAQEWILLSVAAAQTGLIHVYFYRNDGVSQAHNEMFSVGEGHNAAHH